MPRSPHISYVDGDLSVDGVGLSTIAEAVGTPTYVYSAAGIAEAYRTYADALADQGVMICYACKANGALAVIRHLVLQGAGVDVVSGGELLRALAAGCPPEKIVFSGVGKSADEMRLALSHGIFQLNVESLPELELLSRVATEMGVVAPIALRVNPDVDAKTHEKITTGRKENKFGIDADQAVEVYRTAVGLPGVRPVGFAVHIGSQLLDLAPYEAAYNRLADLVRDVRAEGMLIERLDLGGGLGIAYKGETLPSLQGYAEIIRRTVGNLGCHLAIEPGRSLVGSAGLLLAKVQFVKDATTRRFLILDAAMNDLLRPALYEAHHEIVPVTEPQPGEEEVLVDIVGPVCESGDTFAKQRSLPPVEAGRMVAFLDAGAYGAVMASDYNARPHPAEVLVEDGRFAIVRARPTLEELMARDTLPEWIPAP